GHWGIEHKYFHVRSRFFFLCIVAKVKAYIRSCDACFCNKSILHLPYGQLR
ncbi:hypothetical protein BJ508DRAFT_185534, partial [Ascobolus immersus RN42]